VTIPGLTNGTTYTIKLRAVNAQGPGAASAAVSVTPVAGDTDGDGISDAEDAFPNAVTAASSNGISLVSTPTTASSGCTLQPELYVVSETFLSSVPADLIEVSGKSVGFVLTGCASGESIQVSIDFGQPLPTGSQAYKVSQSGWALISDAAVDAGTVSYAITDNGPLDSDPTPGTIKDPIAVAMSRTVTAQPEPNAIPVPALSREMVLLLGFLLIAMLAIRSRASIRSR
jgi:hypothetical protein